MWREGIHRHFVDLEAQNRGETKLAVPQPPSSRAPRQTSAALLDAASDTADRLDMPETGAHTPIIFPV